MLWFFDLTYVDGAVTVHRKEIRKLTFRAQALLEQKFIFQIGTLNSDGINERFSFN